MKKLLAILVSALFLCSCAGGEPDKRQEPLPEPEKVGLASQALPDSPFASNRAARGELFEGLPASARLAEIQKTGLLTIGVPCQSGGRNAGFAGENNSVGIVVEAACDDHGPQGRPRGFYPDFSAAIGRLLGLKVNLLPLRAGQEWEEERSKCDLLIANRPAGEMAEKDGPREGRHILHGLQLKNVPGIVSEDRFALLNGGKSCLYCETTDPVASYFEFCVDFCGPADAGLWKSASEAEDVYFDLMVPSEDPAIQMLADRAVGRLYDSGAYQAIWRRWFWRETP